MNPLKIFIISALLFLPFSILSAEEALPAGDGITDDTAAIQALLDTGNPVIALPAPKVCYLISQTLKIHSNQTLRLDERTTIRLADRAMQYLIANADYEAGNENITIDGGIWDGNNTAQTCPYHEPGFVGDQTEFSQDIYLGVLMQFKNVRNLTIRNVTFKDPETYAAQLGNVIDFDVSNIRFDYNMKKLNMDGIHLNGGCRRGRVVNLHGNTNDDMVALNANDGIVSELTRGEISDIVIDGLWADNGYTAVRLLSSGDPVRRVHISNIFGSWRLYIVSFTHHDVHPGNKLIEDIYIDHIYTAKQVDPVSSIPEEDFQRYFRQGQPLFMIQSGMNLRNIMIENLVRREYLDDAAATIDVGPGAVVDSLYLRNITLENNSHSPFTFLENNGLIKRLETESVQLLPSGAPINERTGNGTVEEDD